MKMSLTIIFICCISLLTGCSGKKSQEELALIDALQRRNLDWYPDISLGTQDNGNIWFVSINGDKFTDPVPLEKVPIKMLILKNTGLDNLNFINSKAIKSNLITLHLEGNRQLKTYQILVDSNIQNIDICNETNFTDVSILGEKTLNIKLINTGMENIDFAFPEKIRSLTVMLNRRVKSYSQINKMINLESLEVDRAKDIDFTKLRKLRKLVISHGNLSVFPKLANDSLDELRINQCVLLDNIDALHGMKIERFSLILSSENQLKKFTKILLTMEIAHFNIHSFDSQLELPSELKKIKGLISLKYQNKFIINNNLCDIGK